MKQPFIKICGIRTYDEAKNALDCGTTALGFLIGITHFTEDKIDDDTAKSIIAKLPRNTNTVMVTHLTNADEIIALANFTEVSTVQLHDHVALEEVVRIKAALANKVILKAVHVTGSEALDYAKSYSKIVDGLLLDSRTKERLGGTGQIHDWTISRQIVIQIDSISVYLAGGLNPENVEHAIQKVSPAGVDVNSGVEDRSGNKSKTKMLAFVEAANAAFRRDNL